MKKDEHNQSYRASVGAIIVNPKKEFFLIQLEHYSHDEWDFVKGGMKQGESELETLTRELKEEVGDSFEYQILRKSVWKIIYEWPIELQQKMGFRGQARISYWVLLKDGKINPNRNELTNEKWFKEEEIEEVLLKSRVAPVEIQISKMDWNAIKNEFKNSLVN